LIAAALCYSGGLFLAKSKKRISAGFVHVPLIEKPDEKKAEAGGRSNFE